MAHEMINILSKQTRSRVRELLSKYRLEDPDTTNLKRERFMALLKNRYGYTNEKSVDEIERLLKQFYRTNKSLGIRHLPPNFQ